MAFRKIIFSDIDGTLLDKHRQLSQQTLDAFERIRESIQLVLISSRMPKGMVYFQDELKIKNAPLVCYNGGLILRDTHGDYMREANILLDVAIPSFIVKGISNYLGDKEANLSVYSYDNWYSNKADYWTEREENNTRVKSQIVSPAFFEDNEIPAHKIMVMGEKEEIDAAYTYIETAFPSVELYRSKDTYIEIADRSTSKGIAVDKIMADLFPSVDVKDSIAFGDNYNDIPLFHSVGCTVAVENGRAELKNIADHICPHNKAHGVATFLNDSFDLL